MQLSATIEFQMPFIIFAFKLFVYKMYFLICFFILLTGVQSPDCELLKAIECDKSVSAGNLHPYFAPEEKKVKKLDTRSPKGFKPFYFSYYGRHGSRHLTGSASFISSYAELFNSLHDDSQLTVDGEKLKNWIDWIHEKHTGNMEQLTEEGFREEQAISARFSKRYRRVFRQRMRRTVVSRSSPVLRSAMTGTSFILELQRNNPGLEYDVKAGNRYYFTRWDPNPELDACTAHIGDSLRREYFDTTAFCTRFFKDEKHLRTALLGKSIVDTQYEIMHILSVCKCIDPEADPFSLFSVQELFNYAVVQNACVASWFIHSKETGIYRDTNAGAHLLNEIICRADEAIEGNGICADLRFGHDSGVAPLFSFLNIAGYNFCASLADSYIYWPAYKHVPMACNFALVLYRNRKGEVLVKILENEKETAVPAISPFSGPYYKWEDFKEYCTRRI